MVTPEQQARQKIDAQLKAAGWVLQDMKDFNRNAALGVAVRKFQLPAGPCDYLLFIAGKAAGVIEAKNASGVTRVQQLRALGGRVTCRTNRSLLSW